MAETLFKVDVNKPMQDQEVPGHNRWHPDIPAATSTDPGTDFRIECLDWTNLQVRNDDSADDIREIDLTPCHVLSGPIHVNGAEPGDLPSSPLPWRPSGRRTTTPDGRRAPGRTSDSFRRPGCRPAAPSRCPEQTRTAPR
jgi:hypothetical protein